VRLTALILAALAAAAGVLDLAMTLAWLPPLGAALGGTAAACALVVLAQRVRVYPVPDRPQNSLRVRR
jgi:UDP-GlcNAc:undecaprenyl-phosphate GlcNAc-1-phosphate transferase